MMKAEFENLVGKSVTDAEYKVIEKVYTWHPAIKNTTGKEQMKALYLHFGIGVIKGMLPIAEKMEKLDGEKRHLKAQMQVIKRREEMLAAGDTELEEVIEKVGALYMKANTEAEVNQMMDNLEVEAELKDTAKFVLGC